MAATRLEDLFKDWNQETVSEVIDDNSTFPNSLNNLYESTTNTRPSKNSCTDEVNNNFKAKEKALGKTMSQELLPLKKSSSEENDSDEVGDCLPCKKKPPLTGIILFVLNCGGMVLFFMMMMIYTGGVIRTIERRFGLRSQQTGLLSSMNDITHICIVVFIGYFGRKGNKPRMISVTILFSSIGGILMAAPYFIFPDAPVRALNAPISKPGGLYSNTSQAIKPESSSSLLTSKLQFCQLEKSNGSDECWKMTEAGEKVSTVMDGVHPAYTFFVIAQLISGVGSSSVFTLSLAYIDENTPKDKSSVFLGVLTSLYSFGPLCGFMLAGLTLRLPEHLGTTPTDTPDDPTWIGNWWLGYLICSVALVILSVPMWFFPKKLASAPPLDPSRNTGSRREVHGVLAQIKEFPRDTLHLMKNKLYLVNLVSVVCGAYMVMGIFTNLVRYIEIHFLERAFVGSIIAALVLALAGGIGGLTGGVLMNRLKLTPPGALKLMIFSNAAFICGTFIVLFLGCPQVQMAGNVNPSNGLIDVHMDCNAGCSCLTSRLAYSPVCGSDGVTYFSSCFAGCKDFINGTYTGCTCVAGGRATPGLCKPECGYLIPYAVTMFTACVLASLARVPATIVNFRIVDDDERSFALGMNSFAINLLGFIPAPILFGSLIDSSCRLWQSSCGKTGACLLFNTARFRNVTYGTALGFQILDIVFVCILFVLVLRSDRMKRAFSLVGVNKSEENAEKPEKKDSERNEKESPENGNGKAEKIAEIQVEKNGIAEDKVQIRNGDIKMELERLRSSDV